MKRHHPLRVLVSAVGFFVAGYMRGTAEAELDAAKKKLERAKSLNERASMLESLIAAERSTSTYDSETESTEH